MFVLLVRYKCKPGCRDAYYDTIRKERIDEMSRSEEGCLRYEYSYGMADDELLLTEVWRDAEAIEVHKNSEHFARLGEIKSEYVENTEIMKFSAEQVSS
ncbi:MAG: antibiotic biosynthesis monooxygenase [Lachnospiraceae bacterium]|nr:antibiotic biosynthesis monooxygenase [Lachnospiraceae bacterium]